MNASKSGNTYALIVLFAFNVLCIDGSISVLSHQAIPNLTLMLLRKEGLKIKIPALTPHRNKSTQQDITKHNENLPMQYTEKCLAIKLKKKKNHWKVFDNSQNIDSEAVLTCDHNLSFGAKNLKNIPVLLFESGV